MLLTYSQVNTIKELDIDTLLIMLGMNTNMPGREAHQDGGLHSHELAYRKALQQT